MNEPINDGGPAFPSTRKYYEATLEQDGMSLRDYFAAEALVCLSSLWMDSAKEKDAENVAREAYRIADAMIAERSKPKNP